jgi:hypothetical protein
MARALIGPPYGPPLVQTPCPAYATVEKSVPMAKRSQAPL